MFFATLTHLMTIVMNALHDNHYEEHRCADDLKPRRPSIADSRRRVRTGRARSGREAGVKIASPPA